MAYRGHLWTSLEPFGITRSEALPVPGAKDTLLVELRDPLPPWRLWRVGRCGEVKSSAGWILTCTKNMH